MNKNTIFAVIIMIALALGAWYWSANSTHNTNEAFQTATKSLENKTPNEQDIALRVSKPVVKLGESFQVTWDVSKMPSNAKGVGLHIVRPDGNYISATGAVGLDPTIGSYELRIPVTEFEGFVDGGNYYVQALVTNVRDPNGDIVAIGKAHFTIITLQHLTKADFSWRIEKTPKYEETFPQQIVYLEAKGRTHKAGESMGCNITDSDALEINEVTRQTCWFGGGGDVYSVFLENGSYILKHRWIQESGGPEVNAERQGSWEMILKLTD